MDVQRAVSLIGRLKDVHYQRNWDYALGLYAELRMTLSEIGTSIPDNFAQYRSLIRSAIPQVIAIENLVRRSRYENENKEPENISSLDETLSEIQENLETLQSSMMYTDKTVSS